jgi:S-DNA-T family DNA segregation ATPase FtsK/SpoIIIE
MSILYKAKPDEVKLILIDPKKIELGVYNGIGHLLVPVVSDPKNAAGALAWSVNEMERRFALIEEVGVREIKAYNEVALREGDREILPQIVIIIDELADLMMTARDSVESSICRIAQKARAAGMHLILGTQRPSVDVITGLIKANVPSRIAFTVASQTDSRTIIDLAGAEKLVGKGDMLYSPVGAMTPTRVQGSFVSDNEIEAVISFLKNSTTASYSEEIMDSIEKEAAKCEKSRSRSGDDDDMGSDGNLTLNSDEMLRPAIEVALDSGTISTSMLQRRLKLGYARAARLIDMMQELGIVSEFAGSKPRTVLISREKYMEMVANNE